MPDTDFLEQLLVNFTEAVGEDEQPDPRQAAKDAALAKAATQTRHGKSAHDTWMCQISDIANATIDAYEGAQEDDVRREYAGLGFADFLHDELLAGGRPTVAEQAVVELVDISIMVLAGVVSADEYTIIYTDGQGVQSIRHITVSSVDRCMCGSVIARCYDIDRDAPRSFRVDRIDAMVPGNQTISDVKWA